MTRPRSTARALARPAFDVRWLSLAAAAAVAALSVLVR